MTWEQTLCFFCMRFSMSRTADVHVFKEDKRGSLFRWRETVQRSNNANDDRSYRVIWGLVIKIKWSGKTGALKWYETGFHWEKALAVIFKGALFSFTVLFYWIFLPVDWSLPCSFICCICVFLCYIQGSALNQIEGLINYILYTIHLNSVLF